MEGHARLSEIADQIKQGKRPRGTTVKGLLKWFDAERRRENVVSRIVEALQSAGLATQPDFRVTDYDEHIAFYLTSPFQPVEMDAINPGSPPGPPIAESLTAETNSTGFTNASSASSAAETEPILDPHADDYLESDEDEEEPEKPPVPDVQPVTSQPSDPTIANLRQKMEKKQLNLRPAYQREYVWKLKPELPSRLIESVLLDIPIPPIYFGKMPDGKLEVIDGQQRLTTLISFVSNGFPLQKLRGLRTLNHKYYRDLPEVHQSKIDDAPIHCVSISMGERNDLKYEIFERLNRGSMSLNEQEVRNCVNRGPFNDLLATLENDIAWRRVKGGSSPEPRFKEREMILRFFAFANRRSYYGGNLKQFLNDYMEHRAPTTTEELKAQAGMFRQTMQNIYAVFGDNSARLYNVSVKNNNGSWDAKFSITALDIQASALLGQSGSKVQAAAEQIRESFLFLQLTDIDIQKSIARQTGSTRATNIRWTLFRARVQEILDDTVIEPRFFSYEFREQLYRESKKCLLCKNQINSFGDCTVDHITAYSRGGKTEPENGQLAHRSCNARKNAGSLTSTADGFK